MGTTQLERHRQPRPLTLHRLSRESGIPERCLVFLVRRGQILPGRSGIQYDANDIFEVLAGLDLPPGTPISVRLLRDRLREHTCT
jgi:hypothetical protein